VSKINDFFYGRYDILCASVEDLKQGKNFSILEYNGCGAEPNHFYDTGYTLMGAYKEILMHWKTLYRISRYNYKQGIKYWPLMKGIKFLRATKKHNRRIKEADKLMAYYEANKDRMDYQKYKQLGCGIIGSGAIESAHRTVIQKRMKLSGQRWSKQGAQNMLNLRVINKNHQWGKIVEISKTGFKATG